MLYFESVLNLRRIFVFPVIKCIFWQIRIKFFVYLFKLKGLLSHANHWVLGRYQHSCPARRVRTSAVSVAKAVCRVPGRARGECGGAGPPQRLQPLSLVPSRVPEGR